MDKSHNFKSHNKETVVWKRCRGWLGNNRNLTFTVHFRGFQRLVGALLFVTLGRMII